jgi:hypothetical protein
MIGTSRLRDKQLQLELAIGRQLKSAWQILSDERGDVPGWVLVVLMTTGLVTGIWTLAAPQIESILRSSLESMNGIR